jgi:AcrR family transcriptional regulator
MTQTQADISTETRRRLLDAAGEVFADRGFANTTVREICKRANANIAAVNYHFGDKQKLYAAVFEDARAQADEKFDPARVPMDAPPEEQLREFCRQFMRRLLDPGRPSWCGRLIAREISEPTGVIEKFVDDQVRPRLNILQEIVRGIVGDAPPRVIAKCALSVVGQMLYYHFAKPVLKLLSPIYADLDQHADELADHVTRFSLAGMRAVAERYRKGQP